MPFGERAVDHEDEAAAQDAIAQEIADRDEAREAAVAEVSDEIPSDSGHQTVKVRYTGDADRVRIGGHDVTDGAEVSAAVAAQLTQHPDVEVAD
jgi:hypothetical protein